MTLRVTLVTDGASDVVLVPILQWLMRRLTPEDFEIRWADLRGLGERRRNLAQRTIATEQYPCRLLFVHRDAERQDPRVRYEEIQAANRTAFNHVCVVPRRLGSYTTRPRSAMQPVVRREPRTFLCHPRIGGRGCQTRREFSTGATYRERPKGRRARSFKPGRAAHRLADLITDVTIAHARGVVARRHGSPEMGVTVTPANVRSVEHGRLFSPGSRRS